MVTKVFSACLIGLDCQVIEVEVDYRHGLSHFAIVGLADKSVQEAKERITSAVRNSQAEFVPKRVIVNLAPADLPKTGPNFDLAIAAGFLKSSEQLLFAADSCAFLGELALNGNLRAIAGVLPLVAGLAAKGFKQVFVPAINASEAVLVPGIVVYPVHNLNQLIAHLAGRELIAPCVQEVTVPGPDMRRDLDLADVRGQLKAKRALEIAAAGGHNLLLSGVPGSGKTMLSKCLPGILPPLTFNESLEVSKIYSVAGQLQRDQPLVTARPFRAPHHSCSQVALVGGSSPPNPGEISLAHRGVLFLDELPQFSLPALEALRQPLEDKQVTIARAGFRVTFPANFMLVGAMNPCRCGHSGDPDQHCTCTAQEVKRYRQRISGPILDRVDLFVNVHKVEQSKLLSSTLSEPSATVAFRVAQAQLFGGGRQPNESKRNADLSSAEIKAQIKLPPAATALLSQAIEKFHLSARGYFRILRVARTIADLAQTAEVRVEHIAEALSFRANLEEI